MINEEACLMPSIKECTHFMPWYDALFIKGQELWFGRYDTSAKVDPDYITLVTYGLTTPIFKIFKEDALCFFDKYDHRWVTRLSKYSGISWQVNTEDDEINLRMLASIAEDELKGSRGDHNDLAITNRIKNRYSTWFEERNIASKISYKISGTKNNSPRYLGKCVCGRGIRMDNFHYKPQLEVAYPLPIAKFVQFNGDYTTVVWQDGSHTTVKRAEGECYDEEKAIMFATIKRMCKNNGSAMARYFDSFYKHSRDISNDKEKKNGSNKKANTKGNSRKA